MGWGLVDWVGRVLPEAKFKNKWTLLFNFFFYLSDRYWDFCKKQFLGTSWMGWGLVEWVGDQLTGWGGSSQKKNSKINRLFFIWATVSDQRYFYLFLIWATETKISVKSSVWGPVDWVRWVLQEAKFKNKWTLFFCLFLFERPLLTRDWKSKSVTDQLTNQPTYLLT